MGRARRAGVKTAPDQQPGAPWIHGKPPPQHRQWYTLFEHWLQRLSSSDLQGTMSSLLLQTRAFTRTWQQSRCNRLHTSRLGVPAGIKRVCKAQPSFAGAKFACASMPAGGASAPQEDAAADRAVLAQGTAAMDGALPDVLNASFPGSYATMSAVRRGGW